MISAVSIVRPEGPAHDLPRLDRRAWSRAAPGDRVVVQDGAEGQFLATVISGGRRPEGPVVRVEDARTLGRRNVPADAILSVLPAGGAA